MSMGRLLLHVGIAIFSFLSFIGILATTVDIALLFDPSTALALIVISLFFSVLTVFLVFTAFRWRKRQEEHWSEIEDELRPEILERENAAQLRPMVRGDIKLKCKRCNTPLSEKDMLQNILPGRGVFRCKNCSALYNCMDFMGMVYRNLKEEKRVEIPAGFMIEHLGSELTIIRSWYSWLGALGYGIPAAVVGGFFVYHWAIILAFIRGFPPGFDVRAWSAYLKLIAGFAVGVCCLHQTLAFWLNKTVITVNSQHLLIKHRPVYFPGRKIESRTIQQVYSKERKTHTRAGRPICHYDVQVLTKDGKDRRIVKSLDFPDEALYLEQEMDKFLRIEDNPVSGELGRQVGGI